MQNLNAISSANDVRKRYEREKKVEKKGDSPGGALLSEAARASATSEDQHTARASAITHKFKHNSQIRQYSDAFTKMNQQIGVLNLLQDDLDTLTVMAENIHATAKVTGKIEQPPEKIVKAQEL
ncbi:hypothetical protein OAO01_05360, partial [Oligoflexia bacterium]|nr:hypothetical protein [Oligoflexia bacterium]